MISPVIETHAGVTPQKHTTLNFKTSAEQEQRLRALKEIST